jgi:hypothetical protein
VRVAESARKHGIADEDMHHAISNPLHLVHQAENLALVIGAARNGAPLEIVVLDPEGDDPEIIHAMVCRPKFQRYLKR